MDTVCIVGAGHAGSQFAVSLRTEGYEGNIVIINDDIEVPYHKPPLSKKYLAAQNPTLTPLRAASAYTKANITWVHQCAAHLNIDAQTVQLKDGAEQSYDALVLATGARNRGLPTLAHCSNVFSLRTSDDAKQLQLQLSDVNSMAILGGGFIGLEVAACLASMGKHITVIEAAERLLGRVVAPEISKRVLSGLEGMGVKVKTCCTRSEFTVERNRLASVTFPEDEALPTDAMLVGIGAIPNTEMAEHAGIHCENGVVVNDALEASAPNVYAIGDCAQFPHWQTGANQRLESVQNAVDQAKWLAKSLVGTTAGGFRTVPWFWSDIGAMKLQIAGIHAGNTVTVERNEGEAFALYHLVGDNVVCVESLNSAKDHLLARKLIDQRTKVTEQNIQDGIDSLKALLA